MWCFDQVQIQDLSNTPRQLRHRLPIDCGRQTLHIESDLKIKCRRRGPMIVKMLESTNSFLPTRELIVCNPPQRVRRPALLDEPFASSLEHLGMYAEIRERHQAFEILPK